MYVRVVVRASASNAIRVNEFIAPVVLSRSRIQ